MANEVQEIFELKKKLYLLMAWARQANLPRLTSERSVADVAHIAHGTLVTNLNTERMAVDNQAKLAKAFGFSLDWHEWRDTAATPSTKRADTADAFIARFRTHRAKPACLTIEPDVTTPQIDHQFADFKFLLPGSFEASPRTSRIPLALQVHFGRRGWSFFLEDKLDALTVGLKQVDLELFFDRKAAAIKLRPVHCRNEGEGNFKGKPEGLRSGWLFTVTRRGSRWLTGTIRRNDHCACVCSGFLPGDKIHAIMSATISDCVEKVSGETFDNISEGKRNFINHLLKLAALNGTRATLGTQVLTVVDQP
jgi:hypothetical protein